MQIGSVGLKNVYTIKCYGKDGQLKWSDVIENLVVTAGLNDSLDKYLKGSSYSAAFYLGLTSATPTVAAGDTMSSHSGWTEVVAYSQSTRPAITWGTVSGGSVTNSGSPCAFSINADGTSIGGAFVTTVSTKSGTTGTLYGGGAFSGGNKTLSNGDTLNVTVTATATAS